MLIYLEITSLDIKHTLYRQKTYYIIYIRYT